MRISNSVVTGDFEEYFTYLSRYSFDSLSRSRLVRNLFAQVSFRFY